VRLQSPLDVATRCTECPLLTHFFDFYSAEKRNFRLDQGHGLHQSHSSSYMTTSGKPTSRVETQLVEVISSIVTMTESGPIFQLIPAVQCYEWVISLCFEQ